MSTIKQNVMRRVYLTWVARMIVNPATFKAVAFALLMVEFAKQVHVKSVFENSPAFWNVPQSAAFFQSAFSQTDFTVQFAVLGMALVAVFLARDIAGDRILSPVHSTA